MKVFLKPLLICSLFLSLTACSKGNDYTTMRHKMLQEQIIRRGISDSAVLQALERVERHHFVPEHLRNEAYQDHPLPIGYDQTISQPYIVAYMTEAARLSGNDRVLEIGTGSGYQAAVLAEIAKEVYSIEIIQPLAESAAHKLRELGYKNIFVRYGDGYEGWPEHAPFDVIIVTAAPLATPQKLIEQLKIGGRMIIPIGSIFQELYEIIKTPTGIEKRQLIPVRFVPMIENNPQ